MINTVMSPNPQLEGINVYPYIIYQGNVYVLDKDLFEQYPGTPVYHKLEKYATLPKLPLFSREMSITELAEKFPVNDSFQEQEELPSIDDVNVPMVHNDSDEDSSISNSMDAVFEAMDEFNPEVDWSDVPTGEEQSKSEKYENEGEGELQSPFC